MPAALCLGDSPQMPSMLMGIGMMARPRIHLDNRADHNALMALLYQQAAVGLAKQVHLTSDPAKREALHRRIREHEAQCELHREIAEQLNRNRASARRSNFAH